MGKFWATGPGFWLYRSRLGCAVRVWWHQLWVRRDEFHRSLSMDDTAFARMAPGRQKVYLADLHRRRNIAHQHAEGRTDHDTGSL